MYMSTLQPLTLWLYLPRDIVHDYQHDKAFGSDNEARVSVKLLSCLDRSEEIFFNVTRRGSSPQKRTNLRQARRPEQPLHRNIPSP